ncbi:MAG: YecH family metal-binding protein [Phycisphaerae bacterium]
MTTFTDIHGHEVLALVAQADPPLTMETLRTQAAARWGAQARYHTCSAAGMTLDGLAEFLLAHGKIVTNRGLLATDPAKICNH